MSLEIELSEIAEKELNKMDHSVRTFFLERIRVISIKPPQSARYLHLADGIYRVDEIGCEKRMPYRIKDGILYISHCFDNHRDYDKWWKSNMRKRR